MPNHGVDKWVIVQIFCTRLNPQSKAMVDSMTNGGYRNVPVNEVFRLLDQLSANNSQGTDRRIPHSSIAPKEDTATAQFASMLSTLNKRFDVLETHIRKSSAQEVQAIHSTPVVCEQCYDVHLPDHCPLYATPESVNYMGRGQNSQNNPYSQTYNPGWRNHPNFSWNQGQNVNASSPSGAKAPYPPGFQNQPRQIPPKEEESKVEKMFAQIIAGQEAQMVYNAKNDAKTASHETSIRNIEIQIGQLASQMNASQRGTLPSDTIPNPRRDGKEECKAINLRSGKQLPGIPQASGVEKDVQDEVVIDASEKEPLVANDGGKKDDQVKEATNDVVEEQVGNPNGSDDKKKTKVSPPKYLPPPPFPQRLKKNQEDKQFRQFIDMFKQLHVNIPFAEALEQMPKYAKFMKDVLTKKRRFNEFETVAVTKSFTDVIKPLPPKLKDPGSFSIPCQIGDKFLGKGLYDLDASVNLMPSSIFNTLGLGEARSLRMC